MSRSLCAFALFGLVCAGSAEAQDVGDYLNVSFSGDGETPTAMERLTLAAQRSFAPLGGGVTGTPAGDVTYAVPIALPTARLAPSVALQYSSGGGRAGWAGIGWSVDVGPTIRRPVGREANAYALTPEAVLVQGGGFDGLVLPFGLNAHRWVSSTPGAVDVSYDEPSLRWTIRRDGITYEFAPTFTTLDAPVQWNLVSMSDGSGNRVDYDWTGSRIDTITYGSTSSTSHFLEVHFGYTDAEHVLRAARSGVIELFGSRLRTIEVRTGHGHPAPTTRVRYELSYGDEDWLLVGVDEVEVLADGSEASRRNVATFGYTAHLIDEFEESTVHVPATLTISSSHSPEGLPSVSTLRTTPVDTSGDGLTDLLSTVSGWSSGWLQLTRPTDLFDIVVHSFGDPMDKDHVLEPPDGANSLDESQTVVVYDDGTTQTRATYAIRRFIDLDGDGFQDVVATTALPEAWSWDEQVDTDPTNRAEAPGTLWQVWYGSPDGFGVNANFDPVTEAAPFLFPRASRRPDIPEMPVGGWPQHFEHEDATIDLLDIDGDGWLDVVQVGVELRWWRKIPERGAGWESTSRVAFEDELLLSTQNSLAWVDSTFEGAVYEYPGGTVEVPQIEFIEARTGFRDLNGDGILDYVDTRAHAVDGGWAVWFGTGDGFTPDEFIWPAPVGWLARTDEGQPWATVCTVTSTEPQDPMTRDMAQSVIEGGGAPQPTEFDSTCPYPHAGRYQSLVGGLIDMDGDGFVDLVDGEQFLWYRNLGDGFEAGGRMTPEWMPASNVGDAGLSAVILSASFTAQVVVVSDSPAQSPPGDGDKEAGLGHTVQLVHVGDIDFDGLPDVVDLREDPTPHVYFSGRSVSDIGIPTGYRPGLLETVTLGSGAKITLEWRTSGLSIPSGTQFPQETPVRKDVIAAITTYDPVTGWEGTREYEHAWGRVENGRWLGFASVVERERSREGDFSTGASLGNRVLGTIETSYELSRDWALPTYRTVTTDRNAAWLPAQPAGENEHTRYEAELLYADHGALFPKSRWLSQVVVRDYAEHRSDPTTPEASREWTIDIDYDEFGNVVLERHESLARPADTIEVETDWVATPDESLFRPMRVVTRSIALDSNPAALEDVEHIELAYDGGAVEDPPTAGLLTLQRVCAETVGGFCAPLEVLEWQFLRTARGAISEIVAPAGRNTYNDAFVFGETTVSEQRNAMLHLTQRAVDDLGRVWEETDPNGLVRRTIRDAFGRTVGTEVRGAGAATFRVETETLYHDDVVPRWSATTRHTWNPDGTAGPSVTSYVVYDGLGREVQRWEPADVGWVVTTTERDVRDRVRWTSEPHVVTTFSTDYAANRGSAKSWAYYDVLGDPIHTWDLASGTTTVDRPTPGAVRYALEDGYEREERFDTHGRLVEVWQGRPSTWGGSLTRTATYEYDGLGRVLRFTDGASNQWKYDFDGAGRVRQVWRHGPTDPSFSPWYGFTWDGPDPAQVIEGDRTIDPVVVEWTYDDLGRTVLKEVWDDATGTWQQFGWNWDTAGWIGARSGAYDPQGEVTYSYTPDPVFGGFGWATEVSRTWNDGTVASFDYSYDADGRVRSTTWPSGAVVGSTYHPNGWIDVQTLVANGQSWLVDHTYDATYGLPSGWTLVAPSTTWGHTITRSDSARIDRLAWTEAGVPLHSIDYTWMANGWLSTKRIDNMEPIAYTYDDLGRIDGVYENDPLGQPLETYAYDVVGNPLAFFRHLLPTNNVWDYDDTTRFNEVLHRERQVLGGVIADDMTYETVSGRLASWDTTGSLQPANNVFRDYAYDGAGRLRRIARLTGSGASRVTTLHYDVDDQLVLQTATGGAPLTIHRFSGWRKEGSPARTIEAVLPMLRLDNGQPRVALLESDGHAMWTVVPGHATDTFEALGAYGLPLTGYTGTTAPWILDHLHGADPDRDDEVVHFGARHMLLRDGLWMQPEPLLYLGLTNGNLSSPLGFGGLYAAGDTNILQDRSGRNPLLVAAAVAYAAFEAVSTAYDAYSVGSAAITAAGDPSAANLRALGGEVVLACVGLASPVGGLSAADEGVAAGRALMNGADTTADASKAAPSPGAVPDASNAPEAVPTPGGNAPEAAGHKKNARPSTTEKHETGDTRRKTDYGGEKGDQRRDYPRKPPPGHRGPWPPKDQPPEPKPK